MPTFELTGPNGERFQVDAPDETQALNAFQELQGVAPSAPLQAQAPVPGSPPAPAFTQAITPGTDAPSGFNTGLTLGPQLTPANLTPPTQQTIEPEDTRPKLNFLEGIIDRFTNVPSLGFGDEISAFEDALLGRELGGGTFDLFNFGDTTFEERRLAALDARRAGRERFAEENPGTALTADVAGAVATGFALPAAAIATTGRAATTGGALAGVTGFGEGEGGLENRLENAAINAPIGFALGGLGALAGRGVERLLASRSGQAVRQIAATADEAKANAQAFYDFAEQQGVIFTGDAVDTLIAKMQARLAEEAASPGTTPLTLEAFNRIAQTGGQNATLKGFDVLRQGINNAQQAARAATQVGAKESPDSRLAAILREELDNFIENAQPNQILTGNVQAARDALREARTIWGRLRKSEVIQEAIEIATVNSEGTQQSIEQALRTQFNALRRNIVKGRVRGFSKEEQAAIRTVSTGGTLAPVLRTFKLANPARLPGMVGAGATFASTADPLVTGGLMGAGLLASRGAGRALDARAVNAANRAAALARSGQAPPGPGPAAQGVSRPFTGSATVVPDDLINALAQRRRQPLL